MNALQGQIMFKFLFSLQASNMIVSYLLPKSISLNTVFHQNLVLSPTFLASRSLSHLQTSSFLLSAKVVKSYLIGGNRDCCQIVFLNSAPHYHATVVLLCLPTKEGCLEGKGDRKNVWKSEWEGRKMRTRVRLRWKTAYFFTIFPFLLDKIHSIVNNQLQFWVI